MNQNNILHLEETSSTLSYIKNLRATQVLEERFTVYADYQRQGRGQQGNMWESEAGKNLLFSTILYPLLVNVQQQFILSQIVSLAIVETLEKITGEITIKWPNDIYWREKKIGGILIENEIMEDRINASILGIGINLNQDVFKSNAPNPISLKQIIEKEYEPKDILHSFLERFDFFYSNLNNSDFVTEIRSLYKKNLFRKDGLYDYRDSEGLFRAEIIDVEDSGYLLLNTESGEVRKYTFKEVEFVLR